MRSREHTDDPLVNLSELSEIELLILKRMREFTIGDHRSVFHGSGFDFVGLRDWQPGDRLAAIERAIGTIGISAVFFQDTFGLITFDTGFNHLAAVRPRIGKNQVIHCLDAYQHQRGLQDVKEADGLSTRIAGVIRKPSLIPVISDFLFDDARAVIEELTQLNSTHDVVLVLIDAAFAYNMPPVSSGWVEAFDVETGRSRVMSRRSLRALGVKAREWQDEVQQMAKAADLDVLRFGLDEVESAIALSEFVAERRLRKR